MVPLPKHLTRNLLAIADFLSNMESVFTVSKNGIAHKDRF